MTQCQSHIAGQFICKSGFVQKPLCHGGGSCSSCGKVNESSVPACMTGEIPEHLFAIWEAHQ